IGPRRLLVQAAQRFRSRTATPREPPPPITIEQLFQTEINNVRAKPGLQQYSQDCLMWFAEALAEGYDGVVIGRPRHKYFSVQWRWSDRAIYFAFEAGHNNARWRAIANEATRLAADAIGSAASIVFRTPDLKPIPMPSWKAARQVIDEAQ